MGSCPVAGRPRFFRKRFSVTAFILFVYAYSAWKTSEPPRCAPTPTALTTANLEVHDG